MQARSITLLLLAVLGACRPAPEDASAVKIVGGRVVDPTKDASARSTVAIKMKTGPTEKYFCSGTLIGPHHIVTAAHCLGKMQGGLALKLEGLVVGSGPSAATVSGLAVIGSKWHPRYAPLQAGAADTTDKSNDIGLVVFDGALPDGLAPVQIAPLTVDGSPQVLLAGYGETGESRTGGGVLRQTTGQIASFKDNGDFVLLDGLEKGSCYGDSGGPAYLETQEGLQLIGATSRSQAGVDCDRGGGIYVDVRRFQSWLKCTADALGKPLSGLADDVSASDCETTAGEGAQPGSDRKAGDATLPPLAVQVEIANKNSAGLYPISFVVPKGDATVTVEYCEGGSADCRARGPWVAVGRFGAAADGPRFVLPKAYSFDQAFRLTARVKRGTEELVKAFVFSKE